MTPSDKDALEAIEYKLAEAVEMLSSLQATARDAHNHSLTDRLHMLSLRLTITIGQLRQMRRAMDKDDLWAAPK